MYPNGYYPYLLYPNISQQNDSGSIVFVILLLAGAVLVVKGLISYIGRLMSPDGGWSSREQRHRHRVRLVLLLVAICCCGAGVYLCVNGYAEGGIKMSLPGGGSIGNIGVGVVLIIASLFIMFWLLQVAEPLDKPPSASDVAASSGDVGITGAKPETLFRGLSFGTASVLTAIAVLVLGPIGLIPGGFLFYKVIRQRQAQAQVRKPAEPPVGDEGHGFEAVMRVRPE